MMPMVTRIDAAAHRNNARSTMNSTMIRERILIGRAY
jgi:hypothetical protein